MEAIHRPAEHTTVRVPVRSVLFALGDCAAGALTGAVTATAVHAAIGPETDLALVMVLGMILGMVVHLPIGFLLAPILGMFHVMVPGTLIGMYGGMLFAMRDAMHSVALADALRVGVVFGVLVTVGVQLYDRAVAGPVAASGRTGGD
jgi:hypothetical protein